jgi:hypothetical protein
LLNLLNNKLAVKSALRKVFHLFTPNDFPVTEAAPSLPPVVETCLFAGPAAEAAGIFILNGSAAAWTKIKYPYCSAVQLQSQLIAQD